MEPEMRGISKQRELLAIAPMVDVSNKYFRFLMRQLTRKSYLYTEMLNEHAIIHARKGRDVLLGYSEVEHPVVC